MRRGGRPSRSSSGDGGVADDDGRVVVLSAAKAVLMLKSCVLCTRRSRYSSSDACSRCLHATQHICHELS